MSYDTYCQLISVQGYGNGKRHRTPTPLRLRKIKVVSFKAFLYLKELFKNFRREAAKLKKDSKFLSRRAPAINDLKTRTHLLVSFKKNNIAMYDYEPSRINSTRDSSFWQWQRVAEWYCDLDTYDKNIRGT